MSQFNEIINSEIGATVRDQDKRIRPLDVAIAGRQRLEMIAGSIVVHPIFAPSQTTIDQLKFLPAKWMKGMGNQKNL